MSNIYISNYEKLWRDFEDLGAMAHLRPLGPLVNVEGGLTPQVRPNLTHAGFS